MILHVWSLVRTLARWAGPPRRSMAAGSASQHSSPRASQRCAAVCGLSISAWRGCLGHVRSATDASRYSGWQGGAHMEDLSVRLQSVVVDHETVARSMVSARLTRSQRAAVMPCAASSVVEDVGGAFPYDAASRQSVSSGRQCAVRSGAVEIYHLPTVL